MPHLTTFNIEGHNWDTHMAHGLRVAFSAETVVAYPELLVRVKEQARAQFARDFPDAVITSEYIRHETFPEDDLF